MTDDLFERLRAVDPATEARVFTEAGAFGDLPGRIVAGESPVAGTARRWPRVPRRAIAIGIAIAVLAVGVAVPLALLRPLGDEQVVYGPVGDGWFRTGALATLRRDEVTLVRQTHVFIVAPPNDEPFALSAWSPHMKNEPLLYCETSGWFFSPAHGEKFDLHGNYELGPAPSGMGSFPVRVLDGYVDVQIHRPTPGAPRGTAGTDPRPGGSFCDEGFRHVRPGVVRVATSPIAPIDLQSPVRGATVTSPVRIAGTADVFEATVNYRILGAGEQLLAEGFTTAACGSGCRGRFSVQVPFTVEREQPGLIQVYDQSAKDGSEENLVSIPVTLAPASVPGPPTSLPPPRTTAIIVIAPAPGGTIISPVTISGTADVFEAVVSYRVLDQNGNVLTEGTTMASCGTGCRGDFSVRVRFTVDHRQSGTIQVFEVSAKDGSDTNLVEVPVTLAP
jgi:Immunoglobulin-like domain of bacterial spore germination